MLMIYCGEDKLIYQSILHKNDWATFFLELVNALFGKKVSHFKVNREIKQTKTKSGCILWILLSFEGVAIPYYNK